MKTVSRVFNDEPHVRPHLRERVILAAKELDYRPNLAARQLAANRSYLICLIVHGSVSSYFSNLLLTAASECQRYDYHLVSETVADGEVAALAIDRVIRKLRPEGIILAPPLCEEEETVAAVERTGTPLVRIAGTKELYGIAVSVHERYVSRTLVRHLIDAGHRRIAMIAPPEAHGAAQERLTGYRDALNEAGLTFDPAIVLRGDMSFASGVEAADTLLSGADRPTAIFAANDGMALGAMAVARRMRFDIPGDVAIAGFDDSPGSRMVFPPLTTVRQPLEAMARVAVAALLKREAPSEPLLHELLLRGSTTGSDELNLTMLDA